MSSRTNTPTLDEMVEVIGEAQFVELAKNFGGTRLYVPLRIHTNHEIAQTVGFEAATKLAARYAPDVLRIPLARDLRARYLRAEGLTNREIARTLCMSESSVNRLLSRIGLAGAGRKQPSLGSAK